MTRAKARQTTATLRRSSNYRAAVTSSAHNAKDRRLLQQAGQKKKYT